MLNPSALFAQAGTGEITGRIINQASGDYLRNAAVSVPGTNITALADTGGFYRLTGVPAGPARVAVSYTGLDPVEQTVVVVEGQTVTQDINLTSSTYDKDKVDLGTFIVNSNREGNAKAIQDQRSALNAKKVVATDVYGDIAEGNVGEFLKMMPGVAIDYVEADARTMSVRGLDPKYASITIDGMPVSSAFSSDIGNASSRAFEFEQISIASIETVELTKTPTPDVAANAVAGVVNLRSRGAFDRKGRLIRWLASTGVNEYYTDLGSERFFDDGNRYQARFNGSLNFSDIYLNGKLGVQAGILMSDSLTAQKAIVFGYRFNTNPSDNVTEVPRYLNFNYRDGPKISLRQNVNLRIDYKFSADTTAYLRTDLNNYDATFHNRDLFITLTANDDAAASINRLVNAPGSTNVQPGVEFSTTTQTSTGANVSVGSGGSNRKRGHTMNYAAGFATRQGALQINADFAVSIATNHYRDVQEGFFNTAGAGPAVANTQTLRWARSPGDATDITITQLAGTTWNDETQWVISAANATNFPFNTNKRDSRNRTGAGKLDFRYPLTWKVPVLLKWGASLAIQDRYNFRGTTTYRYIGQGGGVQQLIRNSDFIDPVRMNFDMGGNVDGIRTTDRFALADIYKDHPDWFAVNSSATLETTLRNRLYFDEGINAAYVQSVFKVNKFFDIAPGVRFESTEFNTESFRDIGPRATAAAMGLPAGTTDAQARAANITRYLNLRYGSRIQNGQKYDDVFKYLHLNIYPIENLMFRASYHDAITRPDLKNLFGQVVIGNEDASPPTITAGDPDIQPERSHNLNFSLEYYFGRQNVVSVTWFRSDLKGVQETTVTDLDADGYDGDVFFAGWRLTTFRNGPKSHRTGIELDYSQQFDSLPKPFNGLGIFGNYTQIEYDRQNVRLNRPSRLANGGISYRQGRFNGNIRANWGGTRPLTLPVASGANAGRVEYQADRLMFDFGASYRLAKNISLSLNCRNAFNEPITTYVIRPDFPLRVAKFGAAYSLALDGRF